MTFTQLRTLAPKSLMLFGKFADCTVDQLMVLNRRVYLRWVYYNCSMISFNDHILECLDITNKWCIDKPGTNLEIHEKMIKFKNDNLLGIKFNSKSAQKKIKKLDRYKYGSRSRHVESRGKLQARNHNKRP